MYMLVCDTRQLDCSQCMCSVYASGNALSDLCHVIYCALNKKTKQKYPYTMYIQQGIGLGEMYMYMFVYTGSGKISLHVYF